MSKSPQCPSTPSSSVRGGRSPERQHSPMGNKFFACQHRITAVPQLCDIAVSSPFPCSEVSVVRTTWLDALCRSQDRARPRRSHGCFPAAVGSWLEEGRAVLSRPSLCCSCCLLLGVHWRWLGTVVRRRWLWERLGNARLFIRRISVSRRWKQV